MLDQDLEKALPNANTELGALTRVGLGIGWVKMAFFTIGEFSTTKPLASCSSTSFCKLTESRNSTMRLFSDAHSSCVIQRAPSPIQFSLPLHWVASSKKDDLSFPGEVQDELGYALGLAQFGARHPNAKPWKGEGPGILEIVEDHRGDTYRAVYAVRFADAVYVLHAFQKKSKQGIKTPQTDVKLIAERLKRAQVDYESRGTP